MPVYDTHACRGPRRKTRLHRKILSTQTSPRCVRDVWHKKQAKLQLESPVVHKGLVICFVVCLIHSHGILGQTRSREAERKPRFDCFFIRSTREYARGHVWGRNDASTIRQASLWSATSRLSTNEPAARASMDGKSGY